MPLDFTTQLISDIPSNLDFDVQFEPTKVRDKKYVINGETGEYIGVVGDTFNCASHTDFFTGVQNTMLENLVPDEIADAKVSWRNARQDAWAMMDITLPNVTSRIDTDKHSTTVSQRVIALHGIDGSCSNMVFFGAIDFFCTNGMVTGDYDKIKRKNTSNFSLDKFIQELQSSVTDFYETADKFQRWANTSL